MLARGVCYFPSDRIAEGLALTRPLRENVSMAALDLPQFSWRGLLHLASERRVSQLAIQQLQIRPTDSECPVEFLSGGNRQKVMLARGIVRSVKVFLFDEPTVGVDVSAKAEIYKFLGELKQAGAAILLVSSELPELLYLSSRVYVMNRGRITVELQGDEIKEDVILSSFFERSGASLPSGAGFH
jgi:ribose transport system ATP-binding protein